VLDRASLYVLPLNLKFGTQLAYACTCIATPWGVWLDLCWQDRGLDARLPAGPIGSNCHTLYSVLAASSRWLALLCSGCSVCAVQSCCPACLPAGLVLYIGACACPIFLVRGQQPLACNRALRGRASCYCGLGCFRLETHNVSRPN